MRSALSLQLFISKVIGFHKVISKGQRPLGKHHQLQSLYKQQNLPLFQTNINPCEAKNILVASHQIRSLSLKNFVNIVFTRLVKKYKYKLAKRNLTKQIKRQQKLEKTQQFETYLNSNKAIPRNPLSRKRTLFKKLFRSKPPLPAPLNNKASIMESNVSKRQRLFNMVKTTKDVYIPAVGSSLSNLKNGTSTSLKNYYDRNNNFAYSNKNLPYDLYGASDGSTVPEPLGTSNIKIITYSTYTHYNVYLKKYSTTIKGAVVMDGVMNRKNRLMYSLCKRMIRDPQVEHKAQAEDEIKRLTELDDLDSVATASTPASEKLLRHSESNTSTPLQNENFSSDEDSSSPSSFSPATSPKRYMSKSDFLSGNAVFNERISAFFSKGLPYINMDITVDGQKITDPIKTNAKGFFTYALVTDTTPRNVVFTISDSQPAGAFPHGSTKINSEVQIINYNQNGFAVISDVDDTIKHTGILENKRSIITNTFVHDDDQWSIPSMSTWYNNLKQTAKCDFFYVSNSPIQLYAPLKKFIFKHYPPGVIFLKEYASGGLINNLMSSSSNRKLETIKHIVSSFPQKKFLLIGDSGEHDLEAYLEVCKRFPSQTLAVYIRCSKGSMTDNNLNGESSIIQKFNNYIEKNCWKMERTKQEILPGSPYSVSPAKNLQAKAAPPLPPRPRAHVSFSNLEKEKNDNQTSIADTARQDGKFVNNSAIKTRTPPPVPPKRRELRSRPVERISRDNSHSSLGPAFSVYKNQEKQCFENVNASSAKIDSTAQELTSAADTVDDAYYTPSSQNDYGAYDQYFDKRMDNWRNRVMDACSTLNNIHQSEGFKIQFKFFQQDCLEESQRLLEKQK